VQNGFELNHPKILTVPHVIVFCSRMRLPSFQMDDVAAQEHNDGRFPNADIESRLPCQRRPRLARIRLEGLSHWMEKQTYLALGIALMTAAELGVHALPMEGFHPKVLDEELGLREAGTLAPCRWR
jgi:nitroreductase/dihydropteridine reductase